MLLRFGVENHGSIASYQELLMTATSLKDAERGLLVVDPLEEAVDGESTRKPLRVVPVVAIYGANAAGKSTLLKAFDFFARVIVTSHASVATAKGTPYTPFLLDDDSRMKPSRYDVDVALGGIRYHYGYALNGEKIVSEWLYSYPLGTSRQMKSTLFSRESAEDSASVKIYFGKGLRGENRQISKLVRPNSLFLSVAAQNAHPQLTPLFDFFNDKVARRLDDHAQDVDIPKQLLAYFSTDQRRQKSAVDFLKAADIGISGINFSKTPIDEKSKVFMREFEQIINRHLSDDTTPNDDTTPRFSLGNTDEKVDASLQHVGFGSKLYPIKLHKESAGTLSLLRLIGPALVRLQEGGVLVIDELNSTLHPLVSRELIRLFSMPETNPGKAQLLFTTHDTNLLSGGLLRRDQIWFAEKDQEGSTHIYALSDIQVRAGDDFERGYLTGRFGAVPFLSYNISALFEPSENLPDKAEE